jgi:hypothetical protein
VTFQPGLRCPQHSRRPHALRSSDRRQERRCLDPYAETKAGQCRSIRASEARVCVGHASSFARRPTATCAVIVVCHCSLRTPFHLPPRDLRLDHARYVIVEVVMLKDFAEPGKNAPIVVPVQGSVASPIKGTATLTDAQAAELLSGKLYFNVHTCIPIDLETGLTTGSERRISRWEHEAVLEKVQDQLDHNPAAMGVRRQTQSAETCLYISWSCPVKRP